MLACMRSLTKRLCGSSTCSAGQAEPLVHLDARLQVAQREIQLLHRVKRHIGTDVAVAVTVRARRADKRLLRHRLFHLMDDVRLCRDDQRVAFHIVRKIRSEEHTSELQSLMRTSYAVFCLKKK